MGAGKSAVGRAVADALGWLHVDTDAEIERVEGMSVSELFALCGEARFRQVERAVVAGTAAQHGPLVLSAGGGAVLDAGNRAVLGSVGTVVWLRARVDTLAARLGGGDGRPLLAGTAEGDRAAVLGRLDAERRPLYEMVSDAVVDVDGLDVDDVTRLVLEVVAGARP